MRDPDPPLLMTTRLPGYSVQRALLPYLETIRRASQWRALGFKVVLTSFGWPDEDRSHGHQFRLTSDLKIDVDEAMRTGTRVLTHPLRVYDYFRAGCPLSEFGFLPRDVIDHCEGRLLADHGHDVDALPLLESAARLNPSEVRYRETYYAVRLRLGDLSTISEELAYFANDVDAINHRVEEWMKVLVKAGRYGDIRTIAAQVRSDFDRLCTGDVTERRYSHQSIAGYQAFKAQFERRYEKVLARIEKLEAKAAAKAARQ